MRQDTRRTKDDAGRQKLLDGQIMDTLNRRAGLADVSSGSARQIKQNVFRKIEEEPTMKRWNIKKTIIVAAAICLAGSITAVAAGRVASSVSHSSANDEIRDYSKVIDLGHKQGLTVKAPQQFDNGYHFASARPVEGANQDESGATILNFKSLDVKYEKDGRPFISMSIQLAGSIMGGSTPDETFMVGDITLNYSNIACLFVPPDYEVSEEDLKLQEEGKLNIAYGSSEVERQQFQYISWIDGNSYYSLSSFDNPMPPAEFAKMAEAIIHFQ